MLLQHHPDKNRATRPGTIDVALIKEAFTVLSHPETRTRYDATLNSRPPIGTASRPAAVVSLDDLSEDGSDQDIASWFLACRCGGVYRINEEQMEKDEHTVGCTSCSETIWVGYEAAKE